MSDDGGLSVDGPKTLRGAVLVLLVGVALVGYGGLEFTGQSSAVRNAVTVEATVTEVGVESDSVPGSSGVEYEPRVRFEYEFRGATYEGTRLYPTTIAPSYDTESAAREELSGYEVGETVTAYVGPERPGEAFLREERSGAPLTWVGVGGVVTLLGGALTAKRYRESR